MANITISFSGNITLSTDTNTATIKMAVNDAGQTVLDYQLSILKLSFHKKMYQPTEIIADISIVRSTDTSSNYKEISRKALIGKFKHTQVSLKEGDFSIGDDFYVHEVLPHYGKNSMSVTLKIYSLDKLLTVREACRTFVGKKLGADILASEIPKYIKPWTSNLETKETMTYGANNMHILNYEAGKEHIFPYLVQYNESLYDLLARTANRWGEFLFYEGGKLNIGYDATAIPAEVQKKDIEDITYDDLDDKKLILATDGSYDYEADNSSLAGEPIQESPYYVRGQMGEFGGTPDKWVMKQFPGILMNDKNLPTMMTNLLFDNNYYLSMKKGRTAKRNADHNKRYFSAFDENSEQYQKDYSFTRDYDEKQTVTARAFQEFTELDTTFTGEKYKAILEKELTSGRDTIYINYGTNHPHLKLGSIITFGGWKYIVIDISGDYDANQNLVFKVVASAKDKDGLFYPAVIPAGHVRYAHPQMATITDAKDSTRRNRVRVMFPWETIVYDKKGEITEDTKKLSSPWLTFASGQQGHPMTGKHYEGDHVMVGFQEGNVERPYVIGGLAEEDCRHPNIDSIITSQGMHKLIMSDGTGAGMQAFLGGAISPLSKTFMNFAPGLIPSWKWKKDKYFEGGFELSDYYGIYRITGSTDGRNVTIASNWGDVKINSFTGIDISAPNGDVNISGKNVTIEAGNNLTLESGTNVDYKLWKSKDTSGGTATQLLQDVGEQLAKRLAEVAHPLDLSIVRSAVEIFFRPVEGNLTMKSNRFLKLEAGNNSCRLPTKAYSVEIENKLQDEINRKVAKNSVDIGQEMLIVFRLLQLVYDTCSAALITSCQLGFKMLEAMNHYRNLLQEVANNPASPVCKPYKELKDKFWKQTSDVDWTDADFGINDNVATEGKLENIVKMACIRHHPAYNPQRSRSAIMEIRQEIVESRKELREKLLTHYRTFRKFTYNATHLKIESFEEVLDSEYTFITGKKMPEAYKEMIFNALSREKCPQFIIYNIPDKIKNNIETEFFGVEDFADQTKYAIRVGILNLLDDLGFTDKMRKPVNGQVPPRPKTDNIDASDDKNITNEICWTNYVQSLDAIPLLYKGVLDVSDPLKEVDPSFWKAQFDKVKFWKGAQEIKSWGDGKDGQILFGSGNDTYVLNDSKFEKVTPPNPSITSVSENKGVLLDDAEYIKFKDAFRKTLLHKWDI